MYGKYSRADYSERLESFTQDLMNVSGAQMRRLPDFQQYINHDGDRAVFPKPQPAMYLTKTFLQSIEGTPSAVTAIQFKPDDSLKLTREDSRHQVFFGKLQFLGATVLAQERIAVKAKKAHVKELAMYQLMHTLGIKSFKPFGLLVMDNGNTHLMTKVNQGIKTIDATDWSLLTPDEMWFTARTAVDVMTVLHSQMLFHGDLDFRNVATNDFGKPAVPDPEFMTSLRNVHNELSPMVMTSKHPALVEIRERNIDTIARKMGIDFTAVTKSIGDHVIGALPSPQQPKEPAAIFRHLERNIYRPYRAQLAETRTPYTDIALAAFDVLHTKRRYQAKQGIL